MQNSFGSCWGSNPGENDCQPLVLPLGHACTCRSLYFDCINHVQADCLKHQLVKISKYTSPARHRSAHDSYCILLSQDLKFSRGACFARHWQVMTRQLLNPDHENLGKGLRTFSGMCTLSNCIFQSFSLKCCLCVFVPLLNSNKKFYGCNLIYTAGNVNISYLMSAIGRYVVIRNNVY